MMEVLLPPRLKVPIWHQLVLLTACVSLSFGGICFLQLHVKGTKIGTSPSQRLLGLGHFPAKPCQDRTLLEELEGPRGWWEPSSSRGLRTIFSGLWLIARANASSLVQEPRSPTPCWVFRRGIHGCNVEHLCPHRLSACLLFHLPLQVQGPVQWGFALPRAAVVQQLLQLLIEA